MHRDIVLSEGTDIQTQDCNNVNNEKNEIQIIDGDQKDDFPLWGVHI